MTTQAPDMLDRQARLTAWLRAKLPERAGLVITTPERAGSGYAGDTYLFDLRWREEGRDKTENLVVRFAPDPAIRIRPDHNLPLQYHVMRCLAESDVPVPRTYWLEEDEAVLGSPFFVVARVDGQISSDYPPGMHGAGLFFEASPETRLDMWNQAVVVMAKLHSLDYERLGLSFLGIPQGGMDALDRRIARLERFFEYGSIAVPMLSTALDWVKKNRYEPGRLSLCWGDPRPGNIIYRDHKVAAVLDWEHAHIGVPESDLAYFLLVDETASHTYGLPRLEGLPGAATTIEYYEFLTGRKLQNFFYHEVLQALNLGVQLVLAVNAAAKTGRASFAPDYASNNVATRKLAKLLGISGDVAGS